MFSLFRGGCHIHSLENRTGLHKQLFFVAEIDVIFFTLLLWKWNLSCLH